MANSSTEGDSNSGSESDSDFATYLRDYDCKASIFPSQGPEVQRCWKELKQLVGEKKGDIGNIDINELSEHLQKPVRVAILDTGVYINHQTFRTQMQPTTENSWVKDFVNQPKDEGATTDSNGHGTACADIVLGDNGVAPFAQLIVGKVASDTGVCELQWLAHGIDWAVERDADIISISAGRKEFSRELASAVYSALAKGKIVVCAASNDGRLDTSTIIYPAKMGNVICVGSHDAHGQPSRFSSYGREVDVLGPGEDVWSAHSSGETDVIKQNGTSFAAPFVAGICALLLALADLIGGLELREKVSNVMVMKTLLRSMASQPGVHDQASGHGCLEPFKIFRFTKERFSNTVNRILYSDEQAVKRGDRHGQSSTCSVLCVTPVIDFLHKLIMKQNPVVLDNQKRETGRFLSFHRSLFLHLTVTPSFSCFVSNHHTHVYSPNVSAETIVANFTLTCEDIRDFEWFPSGSVLNIHLHAFFNSVLDKTRMLKMVIIPDVENMITIGKLWFCNSIPEDQPENIVFLYISGSVVDTPLQSVWEMFSSTELSTLNQRGIRIYIVIDNLSVKSIVGTIMPSVFSDARILNIYVRNIVKSPGLSHIGGCDLPDEIHHFDEMDKNLQTQFEVLRAVELNEELFSLQKELESIRKQYLNLYKSMIHSHVEPMFKTVEKATNCVLESFTFDNGQLIEGIDLWLPKEMIYDLKKSLPLDLYFSRHIGYKLLELSDSLERISDFMVCHVISEVNEIRIPGKFVKDIGAVSSCSLIKNCTVLDMGSELGSELDVFELIDWAHAVASNTEQPHTIRCKYVYLTKMFSLLQDETASYFQSLELSLHDRSHRYITIEIDTIYDSDFAWLQQPEEKVKLIIFFLKKFLSEEREVRALFRSLLDGKFEESLRGFLLYQNQTSSSQSKQMNTNLCTITRVIGTEFYPDTPITPSQNTKLGADKEANSAVCIEPSAVCMGDLLSYPYVSPVSSTSETPVVLSVLHTANITDELIEEALSFIGTQSTVSTDRNAAICDVLHRVDKKLMDRFVSAGGCNPDVFMSGFPIHGDGIYFEGGMLIEFIHYVLRQKLNRRTLIHVPVSSERFWDFGFERVTAALEWVIRLGTEDTDTPDSRLPKPDIVVLPFAFKQHSRRLYRAIAEASKHETIVIVPAIKNPNNKLMEMSFPGCCGDVIVIGSHDDKGNATVSTATGRELDFLLPGKCPEHSCILAADLIACVLEYIEDKGGKDLRRAVSNNCVMREILREHCSSRVGNHDFANGYGQLDPTNFFTLNAEDLRRIVEDATADYTRPH